MEFDTLYFRVLKFLNFRPRSEKEIRDYLQEKLKKIPHMDISVIEVIIHKLKQQKFLNDEEFTKWFVRSRTEFKPKGKFVVVQELKQKGVSQEIIEKVLNSNVREQSEKDLAVHVLTIKKRRYEHMESRERFAKAGSMLARRGFGLDVIKRAIDEVFGKMV